MRGCKRKYVRRCGCATIPWRTNGGSVRALGDRGFHDAGLPWPPPLTAANAAIIAAPFGVPSTRARAPLAVVVRLMTDLEEAARVGAGRPPRHRANVGFAALDRSGQKPIGRPLREQLDLRSEE